MNIDSYHDKQEISKRSTQVLALNGKGVHGLMQLIILENIEKRVGVKAGEIFDLMAGSSIGSLLTAALSLKHPLDLTRCKYSTHDLIPIIKEKMKIIFHPYFINKSTKPIEFLPKYHSTGLDKTLEDIFGNTLAKDLNGEYYYPAFKIKQRQPSPLFPFTSQQARHQLDWENLKIKDVLRSTTATMGYFFPHRIFLDQSYDLMDGAIIENNPTPTAYALAKQIFNCHENMTLVSINTEIDDIYDKNWGRSLESLPFSLGQETAAHALIQELLPSSPLSFNQKGFVVRLKIDPDYAAIDDTSNEKFEYLTDLAQAWLEDAKNNEMIENLAHRLKPKNE